MKFDGKQVEVYLDGKKVGVGAVTSFQLDSDAPDPDDEKYRDHPYVRGTYGGERKIRIRCLKRLQAQQDK